VGIVNGIALYLMRIDENVLSGIPNEGAAGLSAYLIRKIIHVVGIEDKNGFYLPMGRLVGRKETW